MSSLTRLADTWMPTLIDASLIASVATIVRNLWKITRFVGLCRLFKRACFAINARLGVVSVPGVVSDRERRVIEGRTSASDRAGPPMIF
ncbi:MAG: hypothetical protein ACFCBV_12320 [Phycisphaerales bacterium]